MSDSGFISEIPKIAKSTKPEYVSIEFGKSNTTMSSITGIDTADGDKVKPNDITKAFNKVLGDKEPGFKGMVKQLCKMIVPARLKAGPKSKHEFPVWCCSLRSHDGTTDDLVKIPIVIVEKIMKMLNCIHPGDSKKYYANYESIPLVSKFNKDERISNSPILKYRVDVRWIAKEFLKKENEAKKNAKHKKEEESRKSSPEDADGMDLDEEEVKDTIMKEDDNEDEGCDSEDEREEKTQQRDDSDDEESEGGEEEENTTDSNLRDDEEHSDASNRVFNSKKSKKRHQESADEEESEDDVESTRSFQVDRSDYGELGIHLPVLHQNVYMDPNTRVCPSETNFLRTINSTFDHMVDPEIIKDIKESCVLPREGICISKGSPVTSIKGAPTFTIKSNFLTYLIHYTASLEEYCKRQGVNYIHNILKSTLKHEGDNVEGLLKKFLENSEHNASSTMDILRMWTLYDNLFHSSNSALSINDGLDEK